jgi:alpha-1,3-glucosyltransferase
MEKFGRSTAIINSILICIVCRMSVFLISPSNDYNIQRGWMDITINLPLKLWYGEETVPEYRFIDYPPLSSWHMYVCGLVINLLEPQSMILGKCEGYMTITHMIYMRTSVLLSEISVFFPSILYYYYTFYSNVKPRTQSWGILVYLMSPLILIVDYDIFQYNTVPLGFSVLAIVYTMKNQFCVSAMFLALAVNYKIYALYYGLTFGVYWVAFTIKNSEGQKAGKYKFIIKNLFLIILSGGITTAVIWLPWLNPEDFYIVIKSIFAFWRPHNETQVGNFWTQVDWALSLNKYFNNGQMAIICACMTLFSSFPFLYMLTKNPGPKEFLYSVCGISLCFYLFSYMVHEKSILFSQIPTALACVFDYPNIFQLSAVLGAFSSYWTKRYISYYIWQAFFWLLSEYYLRNVCNVKTPRGFKLYYWGMIGIHCLQPLVYFFEGLEKFIVQVWCFYSFLGYSYIYYWIFSRLKTSDSLAIVTDLKKQDKNR